MPRIDAQKIFQSQSWYHIYNRGNNKQPIFFEKNDYWAFRRALLHGVHHVSENIRIDAFALMENHFHLLVFQQNQRDISTFMRSAINRYNVYIREKYHRKGRLYESPYKARLIENDALTSIRNYILANPIEAGLQSWRHVGTSL